MMSGVGLAAAIAALIAVRWSFRFGKALISSETFGSPFALYSSAISFWTSLWNGTYCQKVNVVGADALTVGALNGIGLTTSAPAAGEAPGDGEATAGWAPPMFAPVTGEPEVAGEAGA